MSLVANTLIGIAQTWADMRNREPIVEISDHEFEYRFITPDNKTGRFWDDSMFRRGAIYFKGYANPLSVDIDETVDEYSLKPSSYFDIFMRQETGKDMWVTDDSEDRLQLYVLGGILLVLVMILVVLAGG